MALATSAVLIAIVGMVALLTGLPLLFVPRWVLARSGAPADKAVAGYASFSGVRNATTGVLLLAVAIAAWRTGALNRPDATGLGLAWGVVQGVDAIIFARLGNRVGAIAAGILALLSLVAVVLAWLG